MDDLSLLKGSKMQKQQLPTDAALIVLVGNNNNKKSADATRPWFLPWRGRLILGTGLATVLLAQYDYDAGMVAFFAFYLPVAALALIPWQAVHVCTARLARRVCCTLSIFKQLQESHAEELAQQEMDQEAAMQKRLKRQHDAFVGRDALRKRKAACCRTGPSLALMGAAVLLLLLVFFLYDMPSVAGGNLQVAWYEAGAEILQKVHGLSKNQSY